MKAAFRTSRTFGYLLNLLLPGAGHFLWRELLFGAFVFLIMLLAVAVFIIHYLVPMPPIATWLLLSLPLVFYAFTFIDLTKTMSTKRARFLPKKRLALGILAVAVVYQILAPSAPGNFLLRNFPDVFVVQDAHLNPLYRKGEIVTANRLAYSVDLPFLKRPVLHSMPSRFDLVRFSDESGKKESGFVIGLPGEDVSIHEGNVVVDESPLENRLPDGFVVTGDWPLTAVGSFSILVATFNLGTVNGVEEVRLDKLIGRVHRSD